MTTVTDDTRALLNKRMSNGRRVGDCPPGCKCKGRNRDMERLTIAAESIEQAHERARAANPSWGIAIDYSEDPVAQAGAQARGLRAFQVTRWPLVPVGTPFTFVSPYRQYAERIGQSAIVIQHITEPDDDHDEEVLPMYRIRFDDGFTIEAWPEEVEDGPLDNNRGQA